MVQQNNLKGEFSSYMEYLPSIYQEALGNAPFLGHFLKIFERIWSGYPLSVPRQEEGPDIPDIEDPPLEETIDYLYCLFSPKTVPVKFLLGLGGWLNLEPNSYPSVIYSWIGAWHQEMLQGGAQALKEFQEKEGKIRLLLRDAAPLLIGKGTLSGLKFALEKVIAEYLGIELTQINMNYSRGAPKYSERSGQAKVGVEIVENFASTLTIGMESTIGLDTQIIDNNIEADNTFTIYLSTDGSVEEEKLIPLLSFMLEVVEEIKPGHTWLAVIRWRRDPFAVINYPEI